MIAAPNPSVRTSRRIVIVDDERNFCALVEELLIDEGYDVETAADGAAGLAAIERGSPQLMLLDLHMPVLDGFAVLDRLKRDGRTLPVVVVTARADAGQAALARGAARVLLKPLNVDALLEAVRAFVR